jgi:hypothetical protein
MSQSHIPNNQQLASDNQVFKTIWIGAIGGNSRKQLY